jgi:hypothetical protein
MTTSQFRDYFNIWEEQLEDHAQQTDVYGKDVNLMSFFARWTEHMYGDGLPGLKALYDAEQYERPSAKSQFIFSFTYYKRQYDMTFAVRAVRRMFLQVRPDLQASIAGLEDRDLLPKMEDLLGGGAAMASRPDDLSSLLTQLQALNSSDLRLHPPTQEQRQYMVHQEQRQYMVQRDRPEEQSAKWDRVKNLISNMLKDTELQRNHTPLHSVLEKCQHALTRLYFYTGPNRPPYGSVDHQHKERAEIGNESVFNQLVDNIKTVYTLENKNKYSPNNNPSGYSPTILVPLESIVQKIIRIGEDMSFITHYQLMTEEDWKIIIPKMIRHLHVYRDDRQNTQDENHAMVYKFVVLRRKLDTQLTQFIASTELNTFCSMVAEFRSFTTSRNIQSLAVEIRWPIQIIIICLMGYGREYGFDLTMIEALDAWYWRYVNPHGYGMA